MDKTAAISEAESQVMEVLWEAGEPLAAEQVASSLVAAHHWQEATVKSLLNRLLNKGAIAAEKEGRRYLYSAILQRDEWIGSESKSMLDRLFGGRVAPLVAHFGKHRALSQADIAELKMLVEELGNDK